MRRSPQPPRFFHIPVLLHVFSFFMLGEHTHSSQSLAIRDVLDVRQAYLVCAPRIHQFLFILRPPLQRYDVNHPWFCCIFAWSRSLLHVFSCSRFLSFRASGRWWTRRDVRWLRVLTFNPRLPVYHSASLAHTGNEWYNTSSVVRANW